MTNGSADKLERNDIYTAFVVLGLFALFGFFISRASDSTADAENVWVEQPVSPVGYQGYPTPHDDESISRMPVVEELATLPQRKLLPVASAATSIAVSTPKVAEPTPVREEEAMAMDLAPKTVAPIERNPTLEKKSQPVITAPQIGLGKTAKAVAPVVKAKVKEVVKVIPTPKVKPAPKPKPVAKAKPVAPKVVEKPALIKPATTTNYITSKLPCVWVVGIFNNPGNISRVVGRLRLNKYDVGTGLHEKGTYVGVPCPCENSEKTQAELREIFAAQPWLLRK